MFLRPLLTIIAISTVFFSVCCFLATQVKMGDVVALVDTVGDDENIVLYDTRMGIWHYLTQPDDSIFQHVYKNLTWSHDGRRLAFLETSDAPDMASLRVVVVIHVAPFEHFTVKSNDFSMTSVFYKPFWSNGNLIIMEDNAGSTNTFYKMGKDELILESVTVDDPDVQLYIEQLYPHDYPSPDGQHVIVENWADGELLLDGKVVYRVGTDEDFASISNNPPVWSPNNRVVLFSVIINRQNHIMQLDVETKEVELLYEDGRNPVFRPRN